MDVMDGHPRRSLPTQEKRQGSRCHARERQEYPVVGSENLVKQADKQQHASNYPQAGY
jgi:hypothetical protein